MTAAAPREFLHRLRQIVRPSEVDGETDGQLLARFVAHRDEAAFAALVRRHGPMVLGVCRRLLPQEADADDTFQATFLVLVKKASTLGNMPMLAGWLHGVAWRTARKARALAGRRQHHESRYRHGQVARPVMEPSWQDVRPLLDVELERLPARYRLPLVLCTLEGQTHAEAARRLGWPVGTVAGRLSRGRELLRARLARRGVTLTAAGLAAILAQDAAAADLPTHLLASTCRSALALASGPAATAAISTNVITLMEGVLQNMFAAKMKAIGGLVLTAAILAGGAAVATSLARAGVPGPSSEPIIAITGATGAAVPDPAEPAAQPRPPERTQSVKSMAPVVVKTVPQAGDTQVDVETTTEIRVTFSKDMADKSWSFTQISKESFPNITGQIRYDKDKRTCIAPVKLEKGRTYVVWLNPERFQGFRDTDGRPAVFYPLVFETKP